jgi:hypothetical protein
MEKKAVNKEGAGSESACFYAIEPCTSSNAFELKFRGRMIDIHRAESALGSPRGEIIAKTKVVLVVKFEGLALSVYASGRIMIKGIKKQDAESVSARIARLLEDTGALV